MEFVGCVMGQQTNAIIAGMLVLAFANLEKENYFAAALLIVSTGFIKLFGFGALLLFLFYPKKIKFLSYSFLNGLILFFLPLLVVDFTGLTQIYLNWFGQISGDYGEFSGMSIYSFIQSVSGYEVNKMWLLVLSILLMIPAFVQIKKWKIFEFRLLFLAALLTWFVAFNHKAESQTYLIAAFGMALWYFSAKRKWPDHILLGFSFVSLSIIFSDLVPYSFRSGFSFHYNIKALPVTLVWLRILLEMWMLKPISDSPTGSHPAP